MRVNSPGFFWVAEAGGGGEGMVTPGEGGGTAGGSGVAIGGRNSRKTSPGPASSAGDFGEDALGARAGNGDEAEGCPAWPLPMAENISVNSPGLAGSLGGGGTLVGPGGSSGEPAGVGLRLW